MNKAGPISRQRMVLLHIIGWSLLFSLPFLLKPDFSQFKTQLIEQYRTELTISNIIIRILWVGLFYLNTLVLIPRYIYTRSYTRYIFLLLVCIIGVWLVDFSLFYFMMPLLEYIPKNFIFFNFFPLMMMLVASTAYRLLIDRMEAKQKEQDIRNENLQTELSLLRSQVSPHFMFNVLNNMVALARKKSDKLEGSLIQLSQLLRYMLYETAQKVSLKQEVEYLHSYIELQQQRFGNLVQIDTRFSIQQDSLGIEPMLLIPFVENAFKHGTGLIENPSIHIEVINEDHRLILLVENQFEPNSREVKDATSGIGLENVKRRLALLYPGQYQLEIEAKDHLFRVRLTLHLA